jgi:hypothetical protein
MPPIISLKITGIKQMQKDLFQISQMSDIYYTMNLWAVLSPGLKGERKEKQGPSSEAKKNIIKGRSVQTLKKTKKQA